MTNDAPSSGRLYFLAPGFIGPLREGYHRAARVRLGWVKQLECVGSREVRRRILAGRLGVTAYVARWQFRRAKSFALNALARGAA